MLIGVRHGQTGSNKPGSEKLRGWLPIGLTKEGMKESRETAQSLEPIGEVDRIVCSDLPRVVQSAAEIAQVFSHELEPMPELRDWNTGDWAGENVTPELVKKFHDHIENPNKRIPGGETFQEFLDRIVPILKDLIENKDLEILVAHGRVMTLLQSLCDTNGKHPSTETMKGKPPVDPSGVIIIGNNWDVLYSTPKDQSMSRLS